MIVRNLATKLIELAGYYPVVTVTGPRQSGKTTLCTAVFPDKPCVSLEPLDQRERANSDPRGFLAEYAGGAVIDEVQNAPGLLSYLQAAVDADPRPGRFILTGSQHFGLTDAVSQSLAGRSGILYLLPPALDELRRFDHPPEGLWSTLCAGAFPRIHDRGIPAHRWLADYLTTYVERDVRQIVNVTDLHAFTTFLRLCAGRTAQEINLSKLGSDAGITHNTARAWLSVLEAAFLCTRVPAWHRNLRKQTVKAAKLHFLDSGLLCHLLGIVEAEQLRHHPLRGAVFESWVVSEIFKARVHAGLDARMFHHREPRGTEVDLMVGGASGLWLVEAKSASTAIAEFFVGVRKLRAQLDETREWPTIQARVVYGGQETQRRSDAILVSWSDIADERWD